MTLIKCPECGKEISDKSGTCIGCGFPIKEYLHEKEEKKAEEKRKREQLEEKRRKLKEDKAKLDSLNDKRNVSIRHKEKIVEILDGKLTLRFPRNITITDDVQNFVLEYFSVSMGMNVGLLINNVSKGYTSGVVDIVCNRTEKEKLVLFKEIMDNNGLYTGRSRFSVLYQKTDTEREIENKKREAFEHLMECASEKSNKTTNDDFKGVYRYTLFDGKQEVYCPRCGSENCSHYQEQKIIPGKTKTKYTANLNPLKPFTLVNKKEKVIRKDQITTESKFLCNSCGMIFK